MTNNLKEFKQELKSFAKKVKDFKYTDSALITFLLTGATGKSASANHFSDGNEIEIQSKAINTSIAQQKKDFKRARKENDKLTKKTNLELIQLMEQGDHAVKSPWGNWQFGINEFYNNWQGRYKGHGDKVKDVKYARDTSYKKTGIIKTVIESDSDNDNDYNNSNGTSGGNNITGQDKTLVNRKNFLYTRASNNPNDYVNGIIRLDMHSRANLESEKNKLGNKLGTASSEYAAFDDVAKIAGKTTNSTEGYTFINSGTYVIEGGNAAFSNSYEHIGGKNDTTVASVVNTSEGNIIIHPYSGNGGIYDSNSAAFIVSPSVIGNGNPQILYNAGTVEMYNKKSAIFFLNPNGDYTRNHSNHNYGGFFEQPYSNLIPNPSGTFYDDDTLNPREITIVNRNKINTYGEENVGVYVKTGKYISSANLDFKTKSSNGEWAPLTIYGDSSIGLYVPVDKDSKEITELIPNRDSGPVIGNFAVNLGDSSGNSREIYESKNSTNIDAQTTAGIPSRFTVNNDRYIDKSYGIFASSYVDLETSTANKNIENGHQINLFKNVKDSIGVLTGDGADIKLGAGKISLKGGFDNIGIVAGGSDTSVSGVQSTDGKVKGDVINIEGDSRNDRGNIAIYAGNNANNEVAVNAVVSKDATNSVALIADKGAKITVNDSISSPSIIGTNATKITNAGVQISGLEFHYDPSRIDAKNVSTDNAGAAYADNGAVITMNRTSLPSASNISITGGIDSQTNKNTGFGLFANNGGKINARNNWIKVTDGATNIASINSAKIDLEGGKIEYKGKGYALYTDSTSSSSDAINMKDATLTLDGKAVGYVYDQARPNVIAFNSNTNIDVLSDDVIISDLKNSAGPLVIDVENKSGNNSLKSRLLGGNVNVTSSNGKTDYKYALIDDATVQIKSAIDKANLISGSDSEVFTKRFLYQNSRLHIETEYGSINSSLNTAQINAIDNKFLVPIGLAIAGSSRSINNSTTEIGNKGKVFVDRTDAGQGGVGFLADYGWINNYNAGKLEVEYSSVPGVTVTPNDKAVGMYGTNNSNMVSSGPIRVGGKNSIGILGLSYKIDPATGLAIDPSNEPYFRSAAHPENFGKIDIMNLPWGVITMYGDGAIGIFTKNNSIDPTVRSVPSTSKAWLVGVNEGTITMEGNNHAIGMGSNFGAVTNYEGEDPVTHVYQSGIINILGTQSFGMYGTNNTDLKNFGIINVAATSPGNESIGMYGDDPKTKVYVLETENGTRIRNNSIINVGQYSYGIFVRNIEMNGGTINVDNNGVGIYSQGPDVNLIAGKINVANNNAVGIYIDDATVEPKPTIIKGNVDMEVGQNSVGYLITAANTKTDIKTKASSDVHIGENSVYIYSRAPQNLGGKIETESKIVTDGNNSYGIYSSQDFINRGDIDLKSGTGNVGIYSSQGIGQNYGTIDVGPSDVTAGKYGIGMATGSTAASMGTIENHGTINVTKNSSVGMYASGSGSKAINRGTINLEGNDTVGMYIDDHATGENYGTIQTTPAASGTGIKGVVTKNGGIIKNYGTIHIAGGVGVYNEAASEYQVQGTNTSATASSVGTGVNRTVAEKSITKVPAHPSPVSIPIPAVQNETSRVDTDIALPQAPKMPISDFTGVTTLNMPVEQAGHNFDNSSNNNNNSSSNNTNNTISIREMSTIGMYVDTSGINHTNPIQGLNNLPGLTDVNLIIGTEVTNTLNAKAVQIGDDILQPYNDALGSAGAKVNVDSASLTWKAHLVESGNTAAPIKTVYMEKIPYTDFANKNDTDTGHFLDGLEQRYGIEDINSREKQLFNKLNDLRKDEKKIFAQAVNEMKGYEYSNTQERINSTGNKLDKEIGYLRNEWKNPVKQNDKIKIFGTKDEYKTDTAGVIDYDSNAYGVAYVHEGEALKMGDSSGWYAGAVTNQFKFKDLGKSTEQDTMIKAGIFKTISPKNDQNGSLKWTISGDVFGGINSMHRKFWIVDNTFESKANYYTYGAALKNELGYDIRVSEKTHLRPYGALKIEYGRFTDIKEDNGQMNLEIKGNDYFSVKPEVGAEFKYIQPLTAGTQLSVGLSAAYENELGKLNRLNQARVRYTTADWYNLRNEKEDRKGNGKFDLNIGVGNTGFGVTANLGYDTKGKNIRGGLGFKLSF